MGVRLAALCRGGRRAHGGDARRTGGGRETHGVRGRRSARGGDAQQPPFYRSGPGLHLPAPRCPWSRPGPLADQQNALGTWRC